MENKMHEVSGESQLLLVEKSVGLFSTVLRYGNGTEEYLSAATPAKDLIAAAEIDYREYRREIKRLREEHPLFEERLDISMNDFEDFVAEALLLLSMLQKTDPVSFFVLGKLLHQSLQTEDDGSASFLLNASAELLYILEDPIRVQTCLRNIFEMIFDGMERAKQRERFEKLCRAYPDMYTAQSTNLAPKVLTSLYFSPVSVCYNYKKVEGLHGKSGNIFEYGCLVITFRREQLEIVGINP